ncbi:MAG: molybdenum hydroxylase, partial [Spirochaetaceae bacterium]|nr:molybdenum hydroxylase [Spirochaetaceae bacterium]
GGFTTERLIRSPADGVWRTSAAIGDYVHKGECIAAVEGRKVQARLDGIVRGLLPEGFTVQCGMKCGDIDPRCQKDHCWTVSDKALAIGGGVLEALYALRTAWN